MIDAEARIVDVASVGSDTVAVEIVAPSGFDPKPGQFVKLTAIVDGEHVTRFYTLSSPDATDTFELTVEIEPDGTLGPWLPDAAGESVRIEGPYGQAYYDGDPRTLVIAGGPGIGPAVGIGERAIADGNAVIVIFGGEDPPHRDRLDDLAANGAVVAFTEDVEAALATHMDDDARILIYGFQPFVTEALAALEAVGGDPERAQVENFG